MMRTFTTAALLSVCIFACSPQASETTADSTSAVAPDTLSGPAVAESTEATEPTSTGTLSGDEYIMTNQPGYITDPFEFPLDSAALMDLLGPETVISSITTPAGEDEEGSYPGYSFYEVTAGETKLSFYDYSGKHFGDIYNPVLTMRYGINVGMDKSAFLEKMGLTGDEAEGATSYTINDDYGSMSFYFDSNNKLYNVYVSYEEGT